MKKQQNSATENHANKPKKVVALRQNIEWHFLFLYLELLHSVCALIDAPTFQKLYKSLIGYVNKKIEPEQKGDLLDTYVVVEQEIKNK